MGFQLAELIKDLRYFFIFCEVIHRIFAASWKLLRI